jgi:plastocyanin
MLHKLTLLSLLPIVLGQNYGSPSSSSDSSSASSTATATASASGSVQTVAVAQNGLTFSPNSLTVTPGNQVVFQFFAAGHSVTEAAFNNPCQPANSSSLNSGFSTTGSGPNVSLRLIRCLVHCIHQTNRLIRAFSLSK